MRVGVLTGLAAEANLLRDVRFDGTAGLDVARTGACAVRARREAERLVASGVAALVSFGVAGGLHHRLKAGDLILADAVILPCGRAVTADPSWLRLAEGRLRRSGMHIGGIAASDRLLVTPAEKRALQEMSGALAGDMESGAVADVAQAAGLPFLVVRAVSDSASRALPQVARLALRADGGIDAAGVARALWTWPGEWPAVARLALETRAAMATLRQAAHSGALRPPHWPAPDERPATDFEAPAYAT